MEEYARRYNTVEIDQWFWSLFPGEKIRLPDPATVREYRRAVPDNFRFTIKIPNSITLTHEYSHDRTKPGRKNSHFLSAELLSEFLDILEPVHDVLGPLLFQFEYLNRQKMESQDAFEGLLETFRSALPERFEYAVEIRNPSYVNVQFFDFLRQQNFSPVLLQGYWMPPVTSVFEEKKDLLKKFGIVVLRLHGRDRESMEEETGREWNRIVHARDDELKGVARMASELFNSGAEVYVNVNNHYEGSAPLTIRKFMEFLPK